MTFNTQFLIPSFNISLRNLPRHKCQGFAKVNVYFLQCVLANYCQDKIALTTFILIFK